MQIWLLNTESCESSINKSKWEYKINPISYDSESVENTPVDELHNPELTQLKISEDNES